MAVIAYSSAGVTALNVVVPDSQVACRRSGALLEKRREIILRGALLCDTQIFAVSRTVIEPNVAGKLGITVHRFAEPLGDRIVPQRREKDIVYFGRSFGKVKTGQCAVSFGPQGRTHTAARGDHRMDEPCVTIGDNKVGSLLAPRSPIRSNLRELLRLMGQQQGEQSLLIFITQVVWAHGSQYTQLVFFGTHRAISLCRGNKRHGPVASV